MQVYERITRMPEAAESARVQGSAERRVLFAFPGPSSCHAFAVSLLRIKYGRRRRCVRALIASREVDVSDRASAQRTRLVVHVLRMLESRGPLRAPEVGEELPWY